MKDERNGDERNDKTDPGACRHGNFINYYRFHPAQDRARQLPRGVWRASHPDRKYIGLDVGCNAGDLTLMIYELLEKALSTDGQVDISLLGVDLDPVLIERAREQNCRPDRVNFECLDFVSPRQSEVLHEYLTARNRVRFDVTFCFSITMWIHINHGDSGLVKFLMAVCELSEMVVIEPQPWKCYRNASRRLRRSNAGDFPLLDTLKFKGEMEKHIENILNEECHFEKVHTTGNNDWGRKLLIYRKKIDT